MGQDHFDNNTKKFWWKSLSWSIYLLLQATHQRLQLAYDRVPNTLAVAAIQLFSLYLPRRQLARKEP